MPKSMSQLLSLFGGGDKDKSKPEFELKRTVIDEGNVGPNRLRAKKKAAGQDYEKSDEASSDEGEVAETEDMPEQLDAAITGKGPQQSFI